MAATGIKNVSNYPMSLPDPYLGVLPAGQMAVVADSVTGAVNVMGGVPFTQRLFSYVALPPTTPLTTHGSPNTDEVLNTTAPICSVVTQTSRFDVAAAGNSISATIPNGRYIGQRKRFYQMTALTNKTVTITPSLMSERTSVQLNALDSWAELEFQSNGWRFVGGGGTTGGNSYTLT